MDATKPGAGLCGCACWNNHYSIRIRKCGIFLILLLFFLFCGLVVPYLISLVRSLMPAFLPFISQVGGAPPTNGVFAVFMIIASFIGIFAFGVLYETINHRNTKDLRIVRICNNISLILIIICCLGLIVTISNPVGYTDVPNKFEWVVTVLYEHSVGATMILVGAAIFQYVLNVIWWYLPDTSKKEKHIKLAFSVIFFIIFLITVYPMPVFMYEELGPRPFDLLPMKNITYTLPLQFTLSYKICAVCEWLLCLLSLINLFTHYNDLERVSLSLVLRHKSCLTETVEPAPSISLKVMK